MDYLLEWDKIKLPVPGKIRYNDGLEDVIIISKPTLLKNEILYYEVSNPDGYKSIKLKDLYSIEGYEPEKDNDNNICIQR
jgi:hypothetical protein